MDIPPTSSSGPLSPLPPEVASRLDHVSEERSAELERMWHLAGLADEHSSGFALNSKRHAEMRQHLERHLVRTDLAHEYTAPFRNIRPRSAPSPQSPSPSEPSSRKTWRSFATALTITLLLGIGFFFASVPVEKHAPRGRTLTTTLPDGSRVLLNGGSHLSYPRYFGFFRRHTHLEGEAFFNVRDGTSPFVVETFNTEAQVLGTRFGVSAWPEEDVSTVVVEEGRVRMLSSSPATEDSSSMELTLRPGQMSRVHANRPPSPPTRTAPERALAWRTGGFFFEGATAHAVIHAIERRFDVTVQMHSTQFGRRRVSLFLSSATRPDDVLIALCGALACHFEKTSSNSYVVLRGPDG